MLLDFVMSRIWLEVMRRNSHELFCGKTLNEVLPSMIICTTCDASWEVTASPEEIAQVRRRGHRTRYERDLEV